jgi:hypothetical protein
MREGELNVNSSIESATFVVGTLVLFGLAAVGMLTIGVLAFMGALQFRQLIEKAEVADSIIEMEREKLKLERMAE